VGIYLGTRSGKLYTSRDAGKTWEELLNGLPQIVCVASAVVAEIAGPSKPRPNQKRKRATAGKVKRGVSKRRGTRAMRQKKRRR